MGAYIDSLKFAAGSFCLMLEERVQELVELCHRHDVQVPTGGFLERALPLGAAAVDRCLDACRAMGFDMIEVSSGFVSAPVDDLLALRAAGTRSWLPRQTGSRRAVRSRA